MGKIKTKRCEARRAVFLALLSAGGLDPIQLSAASPLEQVQSSVAQNIRHISLVNHFRYQFNRILSAGVFDDLLKSLQERKAEWFRQPTPRSDRGVSFLLFAGGRTLDIGRLEEK